LLLASKATASASSASSASARAQGRRRVKEQMNKRKPDDEFAKIDLSYVAANAKEVVVYCPESRNATATLDPARSKIPDRSNEGGRSGYIGRESKSEVAVESPQPVATSQLLTERHYTIQYGDVGHTYDTVFGPYMAGAKAVIIEDPYIRAPHQITNFVRFCETVVKFAPTVRRLQLITGYDEKTDLAAVREKLDELKQSLLEIDVFLEIKLTDKLHDREVRIDTGWIVKIGRGLDFYQKPDGWFSVGVNDLSLRKCLETKVDIFRAS